MTEDSPVTSCKSQSRYSSVRALYRVHSVLPCATVLETPGFCLEEYLQLCLSSCNYLLQASSVLSEFTVWNEAVTVKSRVNPWLAWRNEEK